MDYDTLEYDNVEQITFDGLVNPFKRLESLTLSIETYNIELLQQLGMKCKQIKHLGLFHYDREDGAFNVELAKKIRSFAQIESLHLSYEDLNSDLDLDLDVDLNCIDGRLPNLRHLCVEIDLHLKNISIIVLPLFRKCSTLEKITTNLKCGITKEYARSFIDLNYFEEFMEIIAITGKSNAQIEMRMHDKIIGNITKNGIVWRNKLLHWMGCD